MNLRTSKVVSLVTLGTLILGAILAGCGKNEDGPQLSDDELLKRGRAGHEAAAGGAKPPAGTPGSPDQLGGQGGRGNPPASTGK